MTNSSEQLSPIPAIINDLFSQPDVCQQQNFEYWFYHVFPRGLEAAKEKYKHAIEGALQYIHRDKDSLSGMLESRREMEEVLADAITLCDANGDPAMIQAYKLLKASGKAYHDTVEHERFHLQELQPRLKRLAQGESPCAEDSALMRKALSQALPLSSLYKDAVPKDMRPKEGIHEQYCVMLRSLVSEMDFQGLTSWAANAGVRQAWARGGRR